MSENDNDGAVNERHGVSSCCSRRKRSRDLFKEDKPNCSSLEWKPIAVFFVIELLQQRQKKEKMAKPKGTPFFPYL